jgi:glutamate racemase
MNQAAIGIFDSGMGGLTVMRALKSALPDEEFIYLGDTARLPYGTKSATTVRRYAQQAARALAQRQVKLIVIACNTASLAARELAVRFAPLPVLGVIEPGARAALAVAPKGPIAVLATEGTVREGAYARAIGGSVAVVQQACPLFVPLAEEGLTDGAIAELVVRRYLDPILSLRPAPRALLLGCTHYPVLRQVISRIAGPELTLVDSARTTAAAVAELLTLRQLRAERSRTPAPRFLVTDAPERFARIGQIFFGEAIDQSQVELTDLQ